MCLHHSPRSFNNEELKCFVNFGRSKPDKFALSPICRSAELIGEFFADRAIDAVARKDQIVFSHELLDRRRLALKEHVNPVCDCATLQDL